MNIKDLELFRTVIKYMNITKAAKELNYVQSNVTSRLVKIEKEVGKSLLIRTRKGVLLTTEGEMFLDYVDRMLQLYKEMLDTLKHPDLISGELNIGATDITIAARIPKFLPEFLEKYPQVEFNLVDGSSKELIKEVMNYQLDGAFITDVIDEQKIIQEKLVEEELVLISNVEHPTIHSLKDIQSNCILVFKDGCTYRRKLEEWVAKEGINIRKVSFGILEGMIGFVKAGLGVALVSKLIAEKMNTDNKLKFHSVPEEYKYVTTVFIKRKDIPMTKALAKFSEIAKQNIH